MLTATKSELMFHVMRLGTRVQVAQLYGVSYSTMERWLPNNHQIRYQSGQMVTIGKILVKRCNTCGVGRELEHFQADPNALSGCRADCRTCRSKRLKQQ